MTDILTDRGIYRSGQTIHAAFVRYMVDKQKNVKPIIGKGTIVLQNENRDCIYSGKIKFDDFGVGYCDIQIPEDADSGEYQLICSNEKKYIWVEQYRRPSFEVKLEDYKLPYINGDTIKVEGSACSFAGIPLTNAKVKYRVKREQTWWWTFWSRYWNVEEKYQWYGKGEFYENETVTDKQGRFFIDVPMLLEDNNQKQLFRPLFLDIIAEVDVVDSTGEVQSSAVS